MLRKRDFCVFALLLSLCLSACGGGSGGGSHIGGGEVVCKTGDSVVPPKGCGRLLVGLTDLDGDFVRYQIAITSLRMFRADGTWIELLEKKNTVDLVQYQGLVELVTVATLPVDSYPGLEITFDYSNADIRVDVNGAAEKVEVRYPDGRPVRKLTLVLDFPPPQPAVGEAVTAATVVAGFQSDCFPHRRY